MLTYFFGTPQKRGAEKKSGPENFRRRRKSQKMSKFRKFFGDAEKFPKFSALPKIATGSRKSSGRFWEIGLSIPPPLSSALENKSYERILEGLKNKFEKCVMIFRNHCFSEYLSLIGSN